MNGIQMVLQRIHDENSEECSQRHSDKLELFDRPDRWAGYVVGMGEEKTPFRVLMGLKSEKRGNGKWVDNADLSFRVSGFEGKLIVQATNKVA